MRRSNSDRSAGFTLIEAMVSIVIVGVMVVAALTTLGGSAQSQRVRASRLLGPALAQQLMGEILQTWYQEPDEAPVLGRESGESAGSRAAYDDVDDYDGWSESPLKTKDGSAVANTTGWTREVAVAYANPQNPKNTKPNETGLKKVVVTVTDPQGRVVTLTALRSESSVFDQQPVQDTTYVGWVGVELQIGGESSTGVAGGACLINAPIWP